MLRLLLLSIFCSLAALLAYGTSAAMFRAQPQGSSVYLEWQAANEAGIKGYEVYRQEGPADDFDRIIRFSPTAQARYHYVDQHILHTALGRGPVTYRLAVHTLAGIYTYETSPAQPQENLVVRSWDTIKQMFR